MPKQKVSLKYIIKQSLQVFQSQGYYSTSMRDIAAACGVLKGSLYHYFRSKEELLKRVIEHVHDYYNQEVFIHAYKTDLTGKEKLQLLANISEHHFFSSDSGCLMGNLALEMAGNVPEFSVMVKRFFEDWIKAMAHIFEEKYSRAEALQLAQKSVAAIEGAVMMMRLFNNPQFLRQAHQQILASWEG